MIWKHFCSLPRKVNGNPQEAVLTEKPYQRVDAHRGYFRNQLNTRQRGELRDVILNYSSGLLPILAPLTLLKHYLAEYPDRYLLTQNYFDPYPNDLALRLMVN